MASLAHFKICYGFASLKDGVVLALDTATTKAAVFITLSEIPPKCQFLTTRQNWGGYTKPTA
jgi:hypothetical protein